MRLDPKYFNLFIGICALVTIMAIVFTTINYSIKQEKTFRSNVKAYENLRDVSFPLLTETDSTVTIADFEGKAVILDYWATWSTKSQFIHYRIATLFAGHPDVVVIAALTRDDADRAREYISEHDYPFVYVDGLQLYQDLQVPGIPSYMLFDRNGNFFELNVGDNMEDFDRKIKALINESEL